MNVKIMMVIIGWLVGVYDSSDEAFTERFPQDSFFTLACVA